MKKFLQLFHTLKHLKFKQFWFRFYRALTSPKNTFQKVDSVQLWHWSGPKFAQQSIFDDNSVNFLNKSASIEGATAWNDTKFDKLWLYNLHYFDDLNAEGSESREAIHRQLIERWIAENPFGAGNGWEPYPLSLRIVNWVKWFSKKNNIDTRYLKSLTEQADALSQQIEYHILGNHVFANAKALIFFGTFVNGDFAEKVLTKGIKLINAEIKEQFLEDGAHFELSPMYHCILLWDLLELIDLSNIAQNDRLASHSKEWMKVASKALHWLRNMQHPDGDISFFNDSAFGIAPSPQEINEYAISLGLQKIANAKKLTTNLESGYSKVRNDAYTIIFDHANVGPDYLPGHAHADTLSFEMSVGKQRVFVNSGTSMYGISEERLRQRKTSAHNTVEVQGMDSSEVWSGFRVARRAYPMFLKAESNEKMITLQASHNGYKRLKTPTVHTRTLTCMENKIVIQDELSVAVDSIYHLHLHPMVEVIQAKPYKIILRLPNKERIEFTSTCKIEIENTTWHPRFGATEISKKMVIRFDAIHLETQITLLGN